MPSPFPGMDPFLEWTRRWLDFHSEFIVSLRQELFRQLPDGYDARIEEGLELLDREVDEPDGIYADVAVTGGGGDAPTSAAGAFGGAGGGAVATLEPVTVPMLRVEQERHPWIEITTAEDNKVVTILEVLSPTNKAGGYAEFRAKRRAALRRDVNWVEIDLLLRGRRIALGRPLPPGDYFVHVIRQQRPGEADVYAWPLPGPLPTVPVPLRPADADVPLDLAAAFASTYERGQYRRRLRYDRDVAAEAEPAMLQWARSVLADAQPRES